MAKNVKAHDQFWLKDQKYSLYDMFNKDEGMAQHFEGGTVYQAFLSPLDYHRWHSPIHGTIEKFEIVCGSYYATQPDSGEPSSDSEIPIGSPYGALIRSQGFLNVVATHTLIYIKADNTDIGLMCFVGLGMAEVSTCHVTVKQGQRIGIGDELGMFHFGGSSHTLVFGPKCNITFMDGIEEGGHVKVNSIIGNVASV